MAADSIKNVGKTVATSLLVPGIGSGIAAAKLGLKLTAPAPSAPNAPNAPPSADSEAAALAAASAEQRKARSRSATIFQINFQTLRKVQGFMQKNSFRS